MKFRGIMITLIVVAFGMMSAVSCARQRTSAMSFSNNSKRGWLGVEVQDVSKKLKEKKHLTVDDGAYVSNVVEDSPAEEAGIRDGDVIVRLDEKTIDDSNDLTKTVQRIKPRTDVKVEIVRGGDKKTLTAKIGRSSTPQAFSFGFGDMDTPHVPRTPGHLFYQDQTSGLELESLSKQLADYFEVPDRQGLLIASVDKGSSAESAGFKAGDVLTRLDGERIRDIDDFHEAIRENDGKEVKCDVIRKGKPVTVTWKIEADADEDEDDDDMSYNMYVPRAAPHIHPFRVEMARRHVPNLGRLKEDLRDLKRHLKENMSQLKREIKSGLLSFD